MFIDSNFHLSYCSNIHPGENWEKTYQSLKEHLPKIKTQFAANTDLGVGLRLSNKASEELGLSNNLRDFKTWLSENGLYVFTMNGFPYGNFHGERVKDKVHAPDWTTTERLDYTLRLFEQLQFLLPEGMEGGVSTSPISYKYWHEGALEVQKAFEKGAENMAEVALKLFKIENDTGKYLHLDVEPEPDGLLENTEEVLKFYDLFLVPAAISTFAKEGISENKAEELLKRYITICYDVCHFSLAFEEPEKTFQSLKKEGVRVGKIQISAALKVIWQKDRAEELWKALNEFDEPTYLHQVTELQNGTVKTYSDLPKVLQSQEPFKELRAHFHVPIFLERFGLLHSTQDHIVKTLDFLKSNPLLTKHLEVETYTWGVLPESLKIPIGDSIIRELEWVKTKLA